MTHPNKVTSLLFGLLLSVTTACAVNALAHAPSTQPALVQALFDPATLDRGPFPSDHFTVEDRTQHTGLRVNLPRPDCAVYVSDCEDVDVLNTLDGFNMRARLSIPFSGPIDVNSVTSATVFLIPLGHGAEVPEREERRIGINQIVWDPAADTLHAIADELLDQRTRYALLVTRGVRDPSGAAIDASETFRRFRQTVHEPYKQALLEALQAARRVGVGEDDLAAASVFTTQSFSHIVERIRDTVLAAPAPRIDFAVGSGGSRALFSVDSLQSVTFNAQTAASGALTPQPLANFIVNMRLVPGAVASVAFGRFTALDFTTHSSGHIAPIATRTGTLAPTGTVDVGVTVWLPRGPRPAAGWPVEICAHGSTANKNFCVSQSSIANSRGSAVIAINAMGHGHGPLSTMALRLTDGTTVTAAAPGSGYDADGNGTIDPWEPRFAPRPHAVLGTSGTVAETAGLHLQLVRALQAGVDVDDDGTIDLDAARIYLMGHSLGVTWGEMVFAYEPAIRAAAFLAGCGTLAYLRPLSPSYRPMFAEDLAARTPSLLNSASGLRTIDRVAVAAPFFNESLPLRDQPPLINPVPGAIAIQRVLDRKAWAEQIASAAAFAPLLRRAPPPGVPSRPFVFQLARSDLRSVNPASSETVRAGDFADRVTHYRHDLNFGLPGVPDDPHTYVSAQQQPPNYARVAIGAQYQIATFFESDGRTVIHPTPTELWETPIKSPLPENLFFLPR